MKKKVGNPKLAVAYIRVSMTKQELGPDAQRASIERWAQLNDVAIVAMRSEAIRSVTPIHKRAALMGALADVRAHGAGLLIMARRCRIGRDVLMVAAVEQLAREAGAKVITSDGVSVEDTPEGKLQRGMLDLFYAYERLLIKARTKAALGVKRVRGERFSRFAPFGYRVDSSKHIINNDTPSLFVPHAEEQATILRVLTLRATGMSSKKIANQLTTEGVQCRGKRWHATTVDRIRSRAQGRAA